MSTKENSAFYYLSVKIFSYSANISEYENTIFSLLFLIKAFARAGVAEIFLCRQNNVLFDTYE